MFAMPSVKLIVGRPPSFKLAVYGTPGKGIGRFAETLVL